MSPSSDNIRTNLQDGVFRVGIHRPEKKNALTLAMYDALADALIHADQDPAVRAVLLYGAGGTFTSGNDLADFMHRPPTSPDSPVFRFLKTVVGLAKPLIAAVNGYAVGIGTTLLMHCDLVYAGTGARFQLPFVQLGLCPEFASSFLLPRLAGHQRAAELLLLGDPFPADKALEIGLINEIVDDDAVLEHALEQARRIAAQPPAAVQLTKALLKQPIAAGVAEALSVESKHFIERLASPEAARAFQAFLK